jgi:hypothetical protein
MFLFEDKIIEISSGTKIMYQQMCATTSNLDVDGQFSLIDSRKLLIFNEFLKKVSKL